MIEIKNILCPIDFSEMSPKVASYAHALAKGMNARVHVIYVAMNLHKDLDFDVSISSIQSFVNEMITRAEKNMASFIKENFIDTEVRGKVLTGYVSEEILNYAQNESVDLIVMGTHGRKGVDRIIFGSVAEKVVKSSKIPVLSIRPG